MAGNVQGERWWPSASSRNPPLLNPLPSGRGNSPAYVTVLPNGTTEAEALPAGIAIARSRCAQDHSDFSFDKVVYSATSASRPSNCTNPSARTLAAPKKLHSFTSLWGQFGTSCGIDQPIGGLWSRRVVSRGAAGGQSIWRRWSGSASATQAPRASTRTTARAVTFTAHAPAAAGIAASLTARKPNSARARTTSRRLLPLHSSAADTPVCAATART